jgi:Flp pilus assembly secretin CpaC
MSAVRLACLGVGLLVAVSSPVWAGQPPTGIASTTVTVDVIVARVRYGVTAALAKRLRGQWRPSTTAQADAARPIACVLASHRGKAALVALLKCLGDEGFANITIAGPVTTPNNIPVSLFDGEERAIPFTPEELRGSNSIGVQFEEFGTRLNFVPSVLDKGRVCLKLETETRNKSHIPSHADLGIEPYRASTTVELTPDQTLVLAGIPYIEKAGSANPDVFEIIVLLTPVTGP